MGSSPDYQVTSIHSASQCTWSNVSSFSFMTLALSQGHGPETGDGELCCQSLCFLSTAWALSLFLAITSWFWIQSRSALGFGYRWLHGVASFKSFQGSPNVMLSHRQWCDLVRQTGHSLAPWQCLGLLWEIKGWKEDKLVIRLSKDVS